MVAVVGRWRRAPQRNFAPGARSTAGLSMRARIPRVCVGAVPLRRMMADARREGKTQISRTRIHTNRFYDGRREGTRGGAFLPGGHGMRRRRYIFVSRGLVARSASYPRLAYTINRSPEGISAVGGRWLCQGWCRDPLRGTNIISAHTPGATSSAVAPGG